MRGRGPLGALAVALLVAGLVLTPVANLGVWVQRQVLDTPSFVALADEVVREPAVRDALARRVVEELVVRESRLGLVSGPLTTVVDQAFTTPEFHAAFAVAVTQMHRELEGGDDQLTLDLNAFLPVIKQSASSRVSPVVGALIPTTGLPQITVLTRDELPELWLGIDLARGASWLAPLLAVLALGGAVLLARRRPVMLIVVGAGVAVMAGLELLVLAVGGAALVDVAGSELSPEAIDTAWDTVTASLISQTWVLILLGAAVAAAGVVWMLVAPPRRPAPRPSGRGPVVRGAGVA